MSDAWSTTLVSSRAPAEVVRKNRERTNKERHAAEMDAFLFLTVDHDAYVQNGGELNRTYDPMPYPEARPMPESDYVGTGIGALYDLGMEVDSIVHDRDGMEHVSRRSFAPELAGWNVRSSGRSA